VEARFRDSGRKYGIAFCPCLHEDSVRLIQEPAQVQRCVLSPRQVVWIRRIPEMKEWSKEERHAPPARKPQTTCDRKRIGECSCMNRVERPIVPPGIAPHPWADGVAGRAQTLPLGNGNQRECLERQATCGEIQGAITVDCDSTIARQRSRPGSVWTRSSPEFLQFVCCRCPNTDRVSLIGKILTESCGVCLGAS
jgi:hypothetical protein